MDKLSLVFYSILIEKNKKNEKKNGNLKNSKKKSAMIENTGAPLSKSNIIQG